ncbi:MAG: stage II sporulation protein D [Syntrophomonadaceae bacterium]|nr:stage II sporulation protein D [Syntrophomonadaceae bacterium]
MKKIINKKKGFIALIILITVIGIGWYIYAEKAAVSEPFINLYLHDQQKVIGMNLEDYIKGTVAAEMPASFEMEALKAQAVCARTYAVKKLLSDSPYPKGADLSDDIQSCQAYVSLQNFAPQNPKRKELLERINEAVDATRGEIIIYDSQPIDALYCSTCGGRTESSAAVWGGQVDYLTSVKCEDCQESSHYQETTVISNEVIKKAVNDKNNALQIKILSRTPGGRPQKLSINQHQIDATALRKALSLPSNWMEFQISSATTTIHTRGYGHGVGLCQWGANGMAKRGENYHQILQKYYTGVSFYKVDY